MNRTALKILTLSFSCMLLLASCKTAEDKHISVIVREKGSGTREAFDTAVGNGEHFLEERSAQGKKIYNTTKLAIEQTKTGSVLSSVSFDKNAIGYVSLGSLNASVKVLAVDGIFPSESTVLSGEYKIQRPFVILTKRAQALTPRASDFLRFLKSDAAREFAKAADCIFVSDPAMRANDGQEAIPILEYSRAEHLPAGDKIVIRGSTSLEKLIMAAAKAYAELYGVNAESIFDIQLEGSSVGRKAVENDTVGNTIGLSSASVAQSNIDSFTLCLDAIAVIVHSQNSLESLTLSELYGIFSGEIQKFKDLRR